MPGIRLASCTIRHCHLLTLSRRSCLCHSPTAHSSLYTDINLWHLHIPRRRRMDNNVVSSLRMIITSGLQSIHRTPKRTALAHFAVSTCTMRLMACLNPHSNRHKAINRSSISTSNNSIKHNSPIQLHLPPSSGQHHIHTSSCRHKHSRASNQASTAAVPRWARAPLLMIHLYVPSSNAHGAAGRVMHDIRKVHV